MSPFYVGEHIGLPRAMPIAQSTLDRQGFGTEGEACLPLIACLQASRPQPRRAARANALTSPATILDPAHVLHDLLALVPCPGAGRAHIL